MSGFFLNLYFDYDFSNYCKFFTCIKMCDFGMHFFFYRIQELFFLVSVLREGKDMGTPVKLRLANGVAGSAKPRHADG